MRFRKIALAAGILASGVAGAKPNKVILKLKERVSMQELARSVQDPASPRFGQYYTPEEIRELAAPSQRDYDATLAQLREDGFKIVSESATHLWLTVEAEPAQIRNTFAAEVRAFRTLNETPQEAFIPSRLSSVESVIGLDSSRKSFPRLQKLGPLASQPSGYSPAQVKTAYGFDPIYQAGINGSGQHVAVATYMGLKLTDIRKYYSLNSLKPLPKVDQIKFNGTAKYDENAAGESELDAEFIGMIAPGVNVHVFASATNDDAGEAEMFTAILDDNRSRVVNYSWGGCEDNVTAAHRNEMDKIFSRAVAQGVNILAASGDSGSDSCQTGSATPDWPAANPNIVAVGGTSLTLNGSQAREMGWSGSGGGISNLFGLPNYQNGLPSTFVRRSYPDVAFNADPHTGEPIYVSQSGRAGWVVVGGTSMAAPQWAGLLALVGNARTAQKKSPLGFFNPILYSISASVRPSLFNDVTGGSNGNYSAGRGWDAVTGFGTPKASALLQYLVSI